MARSDHPWAFLITLISTPKNACKSHGYAVCSACSPCSGSIAYARAIRSRGKSAYRAARIARACRRVIRVIRLNKPHSHAPPSLFTLRAGY